MKRFIFLISVIVGMCCSANAVTYCRPTSWGYAGTNVTGGGDASVTLVKNEDELRNALKNDNQVIIVTQDIEVTYRISVYVNNITLMALPGVKIVSNQRNKENSGIFIFKSTTKDDNTLYSNNIILRNLTLKGPGAYDVNGYDLLSLEGATNIWVDHCDFQDGMDGNFDMKNNSDNITVSWCRFRYFIAPIAHGEGGDSDDHRFSNLIGSGSENKPNDGTFNVTYAFCWWDEGCKQRMTRCRNAELHFLNCYWNSSVSDYYVGPENAKCYFEGCTFAGKANENGYIWNPYGSTKNSCKFVNCAGNLPSDQGTVSAPGYSYDKLSAAEAKSYVTNSSCGAGATLTVTENAEVSSSCDNSGEGGEQSSSVSDFWNFSDADFNGLGTITSETVVRNLHIVASSTASITIDGNAKTVDDISFTHRLKFGGTGNETARHLWFDVTGDCSITVYLTSSSGSGDARTLNVCTGTFGNIASTMSAPVGSVTKETYNYSGSATRIYLYSAASGINLYGVKLAYPGSATEINEWVETADPQKVARKIIRGGQLLIIRDEKIYSVLGNRL